MMYKPPEREFVQDKLIRVFGNDLANKLAVSHLSTPDLSKLADIANERQEPISHWCECYQTNTFNPCCE